MSFQIALSALQSINTQLDNISDNIANTGTTGFKSSRTNFAAMYSSQSPNGVQAASSTQTLGIGGGLLSTGRNLDVAINGKGYFMVTDSTGMTNYTRNGIFDVDSEGHLVDHMGREVQGYEMTPDSDTLGALGTLNVPTGQIPARASESVSYVGNLSADWQVPSRFFNPADSQSYNSSSVTVAYDSLGRQHSVTQYFVKNGSNDVTVHYASNGEIVGQGSLQFGADGQLSAVNSGMYAPGSGQSSTITLHPEGAEPMQLKFDYTGTTQYAGDTATTVNTADGYASGSMVSVQVGDDGSLNVQYSNGRVQRVGMIALASFRSDSGLVRVDGTSWQASVDSGVALVGSPGTGQFGELASGQLEQSNVEVATELVDLMGAQRNYQANTKVINTQNEVMQALMQVV